MNLLSRFRTLLSLGLVAMLTACAVAGVAGDATKEIPFSGRSADQAFSAVVRGMSSAGTVVNSDRASGVINGSSTVGAQIVATVGPNSITLRGSVPAGKFLMGTSVQGEVDKVAASIQAQLK